MTEGANDRAQALRRQAALCLEQARGATTLKFREELVALAATFHNLANSTGLHDFGAVMQALSDEIGC
jgi:hypothetical protein